MKYFADFSLIDEKSKYGKWLVKFPQKKWLSNLTFADFHFNLTCH
jgi:hypothetical protein